MARVDEIILCDNCGAEVSVGALVVDGRDYCCRDCYDGLQCRCGERQDLEDERRNSEGETAQVWF